jgi:dihydroorotate dehydrogenase electron transfer subunit
MQGAHAKLTHIFLGPDAAGQIACPSALVPAPGQYLLATSKSDPAAPLPVPIFMAAPAAGGFIAAPPLPDSWLPGSPLNLRGPLGKGFSLPRTARRVALAAVGGSAGRLLPLVALSLAQDASVLILCDYTPGSLPHEVEILPLSGLPDAAAWADFMALDLPRQSLEDLGGLSDLRGLNGQALVETPLPCGGMADCGACAIHLRHGHLLACKDGPVVDLRKLI